MKRLLVAAAIALLVPRHAPASVAPPAIMSAESGESSARIEWRAVSGCAGYNFYLKATDGRFSKINQTPVRDTFVRLTGLINGQPYSFAVTALDAAGNESPAALTRILAPSGYGYKTITVKGGAKAADYILFTIPYSTGGQSAQDIFRYLPRYDAARWRIFSLEKEGYKEFTAIASIEPGKAYWFIAADKTDLFLSGKTIDGAAPFHIRLNSGWNLVGSPFLYPVDWREVLAQNPEAAPYLGPAVWDFSAGGYEKVGTLLPFHGYMVFNAHDSGLDLVIPPTQAEPRIFEEQSPVAVPNGTGGGGWLVKLSATDGAYRDTDNYLGIIPETEMALDALNTAEPPSWPQHLSVYFVRHNETDIRRSSDIRHSAAKSWITVVQGGENRQVTLSWKLMAGNPKMTLIDIAKNRRIDMNRHSSYVFSRTNTATRKFIITENSR
ncbi:MAG: fibronectin type III domain-containing protein [Nitrospinae bacterium]|nr:fibronectin type III domain-containing protein [Nitrospinota bacterium]